MTRPLRLARVRRALIVAPHPDDETIGCGGLVRALVRQGARVDILVVTDGKASHRNSITYPPRRLIDARARETRAACAVLGIPAHRLTMLGLPDGGLTPLARPAATTIARATARHARRLFYLVWPRSGQAPGRTHHLVLGRDRALKDRALARHRTQLGAIRDDPTGFTIDPATRRRFTGPVERYRAAPK